MDETSQKIGLLIETAEASQQLSSALLERLQQQVQSLDAIVRQEIRRTLIQELREVHTQSQRAVDALRRLEHASRRRTALWTVGLLACSTALPLAIAAWWLPSPTEITNLTAQRADLLANLEVLKQHGARADLRTCGDHHLCVRVDLQQARYGEKSDYFVLHGY
jgi:hypothetical protein